MSSLIFFTDESQALVATDTLATSPDGKPFMFTTKAFIVPHLRLVMAATGAGGLLGKWFVQANDRMLLKGIENLDYHAPRALAALWQQHKQEFAIPESITVTVYHFGFLGSTGVIRAFAYRSTAGFRSERLPYGLGVKPECPVHDNWCLPADLKTLMVKQRSAQASRPQGERVYIGGEIQVHHLLKDGFQVQTIGRFDDYAQDEAEMYRSFGAAH